MTKIPTILHTTEGIKIADTQISLHAVVHLLKAGWPDYLVKMRFEFTDEQMAEVLAYIEQHPEEIEADYVTGRRRAEARNRAWRERLANGEATFKKVEEQWPTWWPENTTPGTVIHIIETTGGPMISNSRVSVYDVMELYDDGSPAHEIREIYNLSPYQVKVALQYIEAHRVILEPELQEILAQKIERERRCREYQAALTKWRLETNPPEMTPRRAAFIAQLEKSRRARGEL